MKKSFKKIDKTKIKKAVNLILEAIGEDKKREGLKNTPKRVADMYKDIFSNQSIDPLNELKGFYKENYEDIVIIRDIQIFSICEHHLLPFIGKAHVAYVPRKNKTIGFSKIIRIIDIISKRLQLQERLTNQIADVLYKGLEAKGVLVVLEAEHCCMTIRGVKKPGTKILTYAKKGNIFKDVNTGIKALNLLKKSIP